MHRHQQENLNVQCDNLKIATTLISVCYLSIVYRLESRKTTRISLSTSGCSLLFNRRLRERYWSFPQTLGNKQISGFPKMMKCSFKTWTSVHCQGMKGTLPLAPVLFPWRSWQPRFRQSKTWSCITTLRFSPSHNKQRRSNLRYLIEPLYQMVPNHHWLWSVQMFLTDKFKR